MISKKKIKNRRNYIAKIGWQWWIKLNKRAGIRISALTLIVLLMGTMLTLFLGHVNALNETNQILSNQTFEIILVTKAEHLDENRAIIEDVYDKVKEKDNIWAMIPSGDYLRVIFERELTSRNDITLYAKSNYSNASVQVYEADGQTMLADFGIVSEDKKYQIFLTNLEGVQDTFDLKVSGNLVEFDYVFDPVVPDINFTTPTETNGSYLNRNNTLVNVSSADATILNLTVYLYNSTGLYNSTNTTISPLYLNFTDLADGVYYFNASIVNASNDRNFTETRTVTIDTTNPTINFTSPTETPGDYFDRSNIVVNVSANDTNLLRSTTDLYNSTGLYRSINFSAGQGYAIKSTANDASTVSAINPATLNTSAFTILFVMRIDDIAGTGAMLRIGSANVWAELVLNWNIFSNDVMNVYGYNDINWDTIPAHGTAEGVWELWAITYNGTAIKFYINNNLTTGTPDKILSWTPDNSSFDAFSLFSPSGMQNAEKGAFDEVRWYNSVLSTAQLTEYYNGGAGLYEAISGATPELWWHADENSTSNLTDFTGNGHTGAISGATISRVTGFVNVSDRYVNITNLPDGIYYFNATIYDSAGNSNSTETRNVTIDTTGPAINFTSPTETPGDYLDRSNIVVNVTATDTSLANVTINVYNSTGLYNSTNTTISPLYLNFTDLADGVYYFNATSYDTLENSNSTETRNVTVDTVIPTINFTSPTPANDSGVSEEFIINVSIFEINLANVTVNWNGTITVFSSTNENVTDLGDGNYVFTYNQTGLTAGVSYFYNVSMMDLAGNSNVTETRIVNGNVAPSYILINQTTPLITDYGSLDPGADVTITVNISDSDDNFDSAILQWKNSTGDWNNVTMSNLTAKAVYTLVNVTFVLPNYESNITYRIWANDSVAQASNTSNYIIRSLWDCTWNSTLDLGSTAGWDQNKFIGNLTVNNTGDVQHSNNNCSLDFRLSYDLEEGRIYYDGEYIKNLNSYTVSAKYNSTISVNATFLDEIKEENVIITLDEFRERSDERYRNTTAVLVSNQNGPYLTERITDSPSSVSLTAGNFRLYGYVRNLMGASEFNENNTAYNVSLYWALPEGFTNASGPQNLTYDNINESGFNYIDTNITFSNLASITPGVITFYLNASGYNLSSDLVEDAFGDTLLTQAVNITFSCYETSDGVYVTGCGTLDGDYTTTSTSTGGGGGGGASPVKAVVTSEDLQLVRGRSDEIVVPFVNRNPSINLTNVVLSVSGDIAKYIRISPSSIAKLLPLEEINITLKITSPTYVPIGLQIIFVDITAKLGNIKYREIKKIALQIHELSQQEAETLLNKSIELMKQLESENISSVYLNSLLNESKSVILSFDFERVQEIYSLINKEVTEALNAKDMIVNLGPLIALAKEKGIDVSNSERMMKLAILALSRGEFGTAFLRAKDAQVAYTAETKGEFGKLTYYLKNYPERISLGAIFAILFGFVTHRVTRLQLIRKRIKKLREEEAILSELMKAVQKEAFESKTMSMEEYGTSIQQYEKRLSEVIEEIINLESKRISALRFGGKEKSLRAEKERVTKMMKHLQIDYFDKRKIDLRSYDIRLGSYNRRVGEIEEKIATLEAKAALRGLKFFGSRKPHKNVKGSKK